MHPALPALDAEVVVVGAGLRGAMLTQRLARGGVPVVLVDAHDVGARAARRRLLLDPGLQGELSPEAARSIRMLAAELERAAPALVERVRISVSTPGGWPTVRALAALAAHDRILGELPPAEAAAVDDRAEHTISLVLAVIHEARLALAYALDAARRGARVLSHARVVGVEPVRGTGGGHLVKLDPHVALGSVRARAVVLAVGDGLEALAPELASPAAVHHELELLLSGGGELPARVQAFEGAAGAIERLPGGERCVVRVVGETAPELSSVLSSLSPPLPEGLEVLDLRRARFVSGPTTLRRGATEGLFAITGSELVDWPSVCTELLSALGVESAVDVDDSSLEARDFEVTPAIERARLGGPILSALARRHGGRGVRVCERVMAVPREAAVVCPCNTVTEAELRHAQREELAGDLSAVARRTELAMGGCAGSRCALRAAQIFVSETLASADGADAITSRIVRLKTELLAERREASVLDPHRRAVLDELIHGMAVASGEAEERVE